MHALRMKLAGLLAAVVVVAGLAGIPVGTVEAQGGYSLRILHTNDHHARIEPAVDGNNQLGGVSRRKTLFDQIRAEGVGQNQLFLDAGDVFQGTLWFNQYQGEADLWFYNQLGYDAMVIGNHEFDSGQGPLANFIRGANFPVLSANIATTGAATINSLYRPWVIIERGGERIGVFGLTTEDTPVLSSPGAGVTFQNYRTAAQRSVTELRNQGINKIIALTHLGYEFDLMLARSVPGIDVVVGGHSHTRLGTDPAAAGPYPTVVTAPDGSPTLVVTAWEWGKWVGDLNVTFDQRGVITAHQGRVIVVDQSIAQNPAFEARIAELRGPLDALRARPVGTTATRLNGDREDVRSRETNLGNLIADAMLERARPAGGQIAIMNGGGIRASIPAGEVTFGQVLEVLPFGNTLARVDLTGTQVREALENGVSQVETGGGRFPQVAGIRFTFDPAAPVNARVGVIEVRNQAGAWVPISNTATYRIITNDFMLNGGDGYSVFTRGSDRLDLGFILADVVEEAIRAQGSINAETDGRIRIGAFQPAGPIAQGGK